MIKLPQRVALSLLLIVLAISAENLLPPTQAQPKLVLSPSTARVGFDVSGIGTGYIPVDNTCRFSSPFSGLLASSACVIRGGALSGSFTVGKVLSGEYVVEAFGNRGDFAQAVLKVSGGAQLQLSPASGAPGVDVSIKGTGFLPTDTTCTISSPSSPSPILPGSGACVMQSATAMAVGSFMIGNASPGEYVIQVTGNHGDSAQAVLKVA